MTLRKLRSITVLIQSLGWILSRRIFTASLAVFLLATFQLSTQALSEPASCYCGRPVTKAQTVLIFASLREETYCCPHCGLSALRGAKEKVKETLVGDYTTGKIINAGEAYFVEGYFTESPCCKGAWIPFENRQDARKFTFRGGGRVVDLKGKMILEHKPVPFKNKPWMYIGIAVICIAIYFSTRGGSPEKEIKSTPIGRSTLVFIATFSLITALAVVWKPNNFDHRVLRLTLDEVGNHTVAGEVEEIVLKQKGSEGEYDIGFHFFNIIEGESPKNVHIRLLNPSGIDYTYCALDGNKFDPNTATRLNLGLGHSFNIDILLKVHQEEYIGGFVFSDKRTGEVYVTIPVYVIQDQEST